MSGRRNSLFCGSVAALVLVSGCAVAPSQPIPSLTPSLTQPAPTPSRTRPTPTPTRPVPTSTPTKPAPTVTPTRTVPTPTPTRPVPTSTPTRPACDLPAGLLGQDLTAVPGDARVVALTFDAGGGAEGLSSILATLEQHQAPATFFLTGDFANRHPEAARRIARTYPVGNHTQNHRDLTTLPASSVRSEIRRGEASILAATGVNPRPFFRFPLGARDPATIAAVNAACYIPFRWTIDTLGWQGTEGGMSADKVYLRVVRALRPGAIVLMHVGANPDDGSTFDADALARIISRIRERGYLLTTLEAVLPATP